jgi:hypothetical protein
MILRLGERERESRQKSCGRCAGHSSVTFLRSRLVFREGRKSRWGGECIVRGVSLSLPRFSLTFKRPPSDKKDAVDERLQRKRIVAGKTDPERLPANRKRGSCLCWLEKRKGIHSSSAKKEREEEKKKKPKRNNGLLVFLLRLLAPHGRRGHDSGVRGKTGRASAWLKSERERLRGEATCRSSLSFVRHCLLPSPALSPRLLPRSDPFSCLVAQLNRSSSSVHSNEGIHALKGSRRRPANSRERESETRRQASWSSPRFFLLLQETHP